MNRDGSLVFLGGAPCADLQVAMERLDMKNVSQVIAVALLGLSQAMPEEFPKWEGRWRITSFGN